MRTASRHSPTQHQSRRSEGRTSVASKTTPRTNFSVYISTMVVTQITCEEESANDTVWQLVCCSSRFLYYKIEHFFVIRDLPQTPVLLLNISTFSRIMSLTVKHSSMISRLAYRFFLDFSLMALQPYNAWRQHPRLTAGRADPRMFPVS